MNRIVLFVLAGVCAAADFPQWRGAARDGVVESRGAWPEKLTPGWKVTIGEGHASPIAAGGRIYSFARQNGQEVVRAHQAADGKVLWEQSYPAPYKMHEAATGHGEGPKSTPVLAGGRLYTLGISGILSSWDATTGKLAWRKEFGQNFKATSPLFGTAMSPAVESGWLIAHVGGNDSGALTAFDAMTGEVKWQWNGDGPGYASPLIATYDGVKQIVTQSQDHVIGVEFATGKLLWKIPYKTEYVQNIVTPVVHGDLMIYSGINKGVTAIRVTRAGAQQVWQNGDVSMYMSSPVRKGDTLFGFSHKNKGQYFALDLKSGKTLWKGTPRGGENAALLLAGDSVLALNNDGELAVFAATEKGFEPQRKYTVAASPTWAYPAPVAGGILIKDKESLALWK